MEEILSAIQIRELYLELIAEPSLVLELSEYKKSKIFKYADLQINNCFKFASELMLVNSKYNYPEQYKGNELEYWLTRQGNYKDAKYIQDLIIRERNKAEKENKKDKIQNKTTFTSRLSDVQLRNLYKKLKEKFIDNKTTYGLFKLVFSGVKVETLPGKIKWIDKPDKSHKPNIQTLYELLFLLKEKKLLLEDCNFDTSNKNSNNLYSKINNCFSDFNNIRNKNPDKYTFKPQQNTNQKKELKLIIKSL